MPITSGRLFLPWLAMSPGFRCSMRDGGGVHAAALLERGAVVTGIDASAGMLKSRSVAWKGARGCYQPI